MRAIFAVLILPVCLGTVISSIAIAQSAGQQANGRSEVPIREVDLSDGIRRYTIPIRVGATAIDAGLDTGSTGLRILPGVLAAADAASSGAYDHYSYGAGTEFRGKIGTGRLAIGAFAAPSTMQLIDSKDCTREVPNCPASRIPMEQFGIQGSGLPGEGFRAIIGVNMAEAEIDSPLPAIGVKSWIIELPRPGDPGWLILNPPLDETKDYVRLPIVSAFAQQKGGMHDSIMACITNVADKSKACGSLLMDTGAPGIRLTNGNLGHVPWPNGTKAALTFFDGTQARAIELFTVGLRDHASHLMFEEKGHAQDQMIYAGLSPYFAFDVLYDFEKHQIGLKPRTATPNSPIGQLVTQSGN